MVEVSQQNFIGEQKKTTIWVGDLGFRDSGFGIWG